jgi:hypothetical protein
VVLPGLDDQSRLLILVSPSARCSQRFWCVVLRWCGAAALRAIATAADHFDVFYVISPAICVGHDMVYFGAGGRLAYLIVEERVAVSAMRYAHALCATYRLRSDTLPRACASPRGRHVPSA